MNVLVTSAARKVWLVRAFQRALAGRGSVVAADLTWHVPSLHVADHGVLLPQSDAPEFADRLREVCAEQHVDLVVPTRNGELELFAELAPSFAADGVRVVVSPPTAVATCLDKDAFNQHCSEHGFAVPDVILDPREQDLPLFARPRRGQASEGAGIVRTAEELAECRDHVFARVIEAPEFTVDVFLRRDGVAVSAVPRERVVVINGESQETRTVEDQELVDQSAALCESIGLIGPGTVQAFRTEEGLRFIEVNPRFGGASALSFRAGADGPRWLLDEIRGQTLNPKLGDYQRGLTMLRYGADIFLEAELAQ